VEGDWLEGGFLLRTALSVLCDSESSVCTSCVCKCLDGTAVEGLGVVGVRLLCDVLLRCAVSYLLFAICYFAAGGAGVSAGSGGALVLVETRRRRAKMSLSVVRIRVESLVKIL
jgi:hypothetical protein